MTRMNHRQQLAVRKQRAVSELRRAQKASGEDRDIALRNSAFFVAALASDMRDYGRVNRRAFLRATANAIRQGDLTVEQLEDNLATADGID